MTYPDTDFQRLLAANDACGPARQWVGARSLAETWAECQRGDWMLWLDEQGIVRLDRAATAPAWAAYDKAIAQVGAAYNEALAQAGAAYRKARAQARAAYDEATATAQMALAEAIRAIHPTPPLKEAP